MTVRAIASLLLLVISFPGLAHADPVEISNDAVSSRDEFGCSVWVDPHGDRYRWTHLCAGTLDDGADGTIDRRTASIGWSICDEDGSTGGSWCDEHGSIAEDSVAEDELTVDLDGGVVSLHADVGACRVDVDWAATSDAETRSSSRPDGVQHYVYPPTATVWIHGHDTSWSEWHATHAGSVCPAADVAGQPDVTALVAYDRTSTRTMVRIDPTG